VNQQNQRVFSPRFTVHTTSPWLGVGGTERFSLVARASSASARKATRSRAQNDEWHEAPSQPALNHSVASKDRTTYGMGESDASGAAFGGRRASGQGATTPRSDPARRFYSGEPPRRVPNRPWSG
jgi:hypothetical protein